MAGVDEIAGELLYDWEMKETADYVRRGRRFLDMPADALDRAWAGSFRQWIQSELKTDTTEMDGLAAELRLRGRQLPHHLVRPEIATLFQALTELDPDDGLPGLDREIEAYFVQRAGPPN